MRQESRKEIVSLEILLAFCVYPNYILHLDRKAAKYTTYKRFCGNSSFFIA